MEPIKTTGIVTTAKTAGDYNSMLTVISGELGRVSVWAKGIKSAKHPARAAAAPLCYSEFILSERGGVYTLSSASLIESFYGIRNSVEDLALAAYFMSLAETVCQEGTEAGDILKLLLNCLHFLEKSLKSPCDLRLLFELRLTALSGVMPVTDSCCMCGGDSALYFSASEGGTVCRSCAASSLKSISPNAAALMTRYLCVSLGEALRFTGDEKHTTEALRHMEDFIEIHIGKIQALAYLKSIIT